MNEQTREVGTLRGLLKKYGGAAPTMPGPISGRDQMDLKRLRQLSGAAFDRMWLEVISGHHTAAIQMAGIEKAGGGDPTTRKLAAAVASSQLRQLSLFNRLAMQMGG